MLHAREDCLVICISPGIEGRWDVSEKGCDAPLASFSAQEQACAYAAELVCRANEAMVLLEEREGFSPLPPSYLTRCAERVALSRSRY